MGEECFIDCQFIKEERVIIATFLSISTKGKFWGQGYIAGMRPKHASVGARHTHSPLTLTTAVGQGTRLNPAS